MTLTKSAVAALLGLAVAAGQARAEPADDLRKAVEKLEKATKDLQEAKDALRAEGSREKLTAIESRLALIDKDIQEIQKDMRDLKRRLEDNTSTSRRFDTDSTRDGQVRLINQFNEEMSVLLNNRVYRLTPGQERLISVPSGRFTYQVLQLQRNEQARTILGGETKTIRIFPAD